MEEQQYNVYSDVEYPEAPPRQVYVRSRCENDARNAYPFTRGFPFSKYRINVAATALRSTPSLHCQRQGTSPLILFSSFAPVVAISAISAVL